MTMPKQKTKIVATIGPASDSPEMLERLIRAGMNVARLNFSHGELAEHAARIRRIREAEAATGCPVTILADLPGPKMRIGEISPEPIQLTAGASLCLTDESVVGNARRISTTFRELPQVVKPGDRLFLNDGLVQLTVERVETGDVHCRVVVGGELRSRKGLNLPGIRLGISAFTARDRECLNFALAQGVDAVSQSFVESAADLQAVREAARQAGGQPFLIAKIERARALENLEEILEAADGLMIARGDLGVEVPIERIALIQKHILRMAAAAGKPVITATQMLESMTASRLPTRAEATDVANAILDGTDCLMLSAESAMGDYPEDSVAMLARIAAEVEAWRESGAAAEASSNFGPDCFVPNSSEAVLADIIERAVRIAPVCAVFVPTRTGYTARLTSRFKPRAWVVAVCQNPVTARGLAFSYGVEPVVEPLPPADWKAFASAWLQSRGFHCRLAMVAADATPNQPDSNPRIEFLVLSEGESC